MNEVVDLSFVDRLDKILARRDRQTESIRENCKVKISRAEDLLEIALEEVSRLIKRRSDVTEELALLDVMAQALGLQVRAFRDGIKRRAETPTQFWQE
jgi:uncharacterized protein YpbB